MLEERGRSAVVEVRSDSEGESGRGAGDDSRSSTAGASAVMRVADEVLPALITRLTASELGELEVAEEGWRVRLRRDPATFRATGTPPAVGQGAAVQPHSSHASTGAATAQVAARHGGSRAVTASVDGVQEGTGGRRAVVRRTAVSPAVGYFMPREGLAAGQAVRSSDVVGSIDVLGVKYPVVAPADGILGRVLASAGEAVEYGQEIVRIDGIERLVES